MRSLAPQQLDPLGGVTAQVFAWTFTGVAVLTTAGMSIAHRSEYVYPAMLVPAFAGIALACAVLVYASSPRRAPFSRTSAIVVHLAGLLAVVAEALTQWGANISSRSDWAPVVLALFVLAMASFRPAGELVSGSIVSAAVVLVVTYAGVTAAGAPLPPLVYAGLTAGPLLAAGTGAAAFSAVAVRRLSRWRDRTSVLRRAEAERIRSTVREELHSERLELVESEVGPFLRGLLERGDVTADDSRRARELGDGVWLDDLVAELRDPHGLAVRMDDTERAAVEAACASLADRRTVATLERTGSSARLTLRWGHGRDRLGPEVQAMLRIVFPDARVQPALRLVELEFDAD
jgi:hypothetical protein